MPTAPNAVEKAIRETHASLMTTGLSADLAERGTREIVAAALAKALGTEGSGGGRKPAKKTGGAARGPKPGGRQLSAHLGKKAFDALDDDRKNLARAAISKHADEWRTMDKAAKDKFLAPILKDVREKS